MKKQEIIKSFIKENKPTRKELVKFIVVEMNKVVHPDKYDYNNYRGYYSVGFSAWYRSGTVIRNPETGRLSLSKDVLKYDLGLYTTTPSEWKRRNEELLKSRNHYYNLEWEQTHKISRLEDTIARLHRKNTELQREKSSALEERDGTGKQVDSILKQRDIFRNERNTLEEKLEDIQPALLHLQEQNAELHSKNDDLQDIIKDLRSQLETPAETSEIDPETGYTWKSLYELYRKNYTVNEMKLDMIQSTLNK